jgi:hypothetical protein
MGAGVAQPVQCLTTDWTTWRSRLNSQQRRKEFPLASVSRPALTPSQPPVQWVPRVLSSGVKHGRGVTLTTHPIYCRVHEWVGATHPLPPSPSMACSGIALLFYNAYSCVLVLPSNKRQAGRQVQVTVVTCFCCPLVSITAALFQYHDEHQYSISGQIIKAVTCIESSPGLSGNVMRMISLTSNNSGASFNCNTIAVLLAYIHSLALIVQDGPLASLFGVSWSHTYRHTVGLIWTNDQPVAETSTYTGQHNI